jgi:hypothetical protein
VFRDPCLHRKASAHQPLILEKTTVTQSDNVKEYVRIMTELLDRVTPFANEVQRKQLAARRQWVNDLNSHSVTETEISTFVEHTNSIYKLIHFIIELAAGMIDSNIAFDLEQYANTRFAKAHELAEHMVYSSPVLRRMIREPQQSQPQSVRPIFITASWRSGTTLLMAMLGAHKNLAALPEVTFLNHFLFAPASTITNALPVLQRTRPSIINAAHSIRALGVSEEEFYSHFAAFCDAVLSTYGRTRGKRRWVYKEVFNAESLYLIDAIFGYTGNFIWLVRHGLDVVNSHIERYERWGAQRPDLTEYAHDWAARNRVLADFCERIPRRCVRVRYEDLVENTAFEMRRILDFVGEPWDDQLFERVDDVISELNGDHKITSTGGTIDKSRIGLWKKWPPVYIKQFGSIVNETLKRAGYDQVEGGMA